MPNKITIIGVGLIGGSIFLGLKKRLGVEVEIKTFGKKDKLPEDADLTIIATPISEIIKVLSKLDKLVSKKTLVMDVGSTKEMICQHARNLKNKNLVFVGTHPMAGREVSGFANSDPNLFMNKSWVVCDKNDTVNTIIKILGGIPVLMDPARHDQLVAAASSLPLLTASLLMNTVSSRKNWEMAARLASTGFRDTTRLASFDAKIKTEIVSTNKKNLLALVSDFEKEIKAIKFLIEKENWEELEKYFIAAKISRDGWIKNYFS